MTVSKNVLWLVSPLLLCACGPKSAIKVDVATSVDSSYLSDATRPDDYPTYLAGEGNIYGCRYGIHFYARGEFTPAKTVLVTGLLASARPEIVKHRVRLDRFDVYYNYQPRLRGTAGAVIGGQVGREIARSGSAGGTAQGNVEAFVLEENPERATTDKTDAVIGCAGKAEGEYFVSQASAGADVVVIWLDLDVDGKAYRFRSRYQVVFDRNVGREAVVQTALQTTVRDVARKLVL